MTSRCSSSAAVDVGRTSASLGSRMRKNSRASADSLIRASKSMDSASKVSAQFLLDAQAHAVV